MPFRFPLTKGIVHPCLQTSTFKMAKHYHKYMFDWYFFCNTSFPPEANQWQSPKNQTSRPNTALVRSPPMLKNPSVSEERSELWFLLTLHVKEQTQLENDLGHWGKRHAPTGTSGKSLNNCGVSPVITWICIGKPLWKIWVRQLELWKSQ